MSGTLVDAARTSSLASHNREAEPRDDAGGSQLAGQLPETTSFEGSIAQDSSSCPTSLIEEGSSSESKLWVQDVQVTALSGFCTLQM